ncbi:BTAD domain-containing putative transcriptional regulator [Kribbella italica]|uniref:DNA-binding SARP family transcriptional activator n=1 Tax=Kribbella italica TaxID=1540520 RepID=A0A7W9J837_9ACTN|nr:DNA-binding SARP family transcriptional activator [Kribbella italica]
MTESLRLDLLGPLRAWSGPEALELGPIRQQSLLAVLALRANQVISPDDLVELVWSEAPPATGAKIVPPYVYRLRKLLPEGVVVHSRDGYRLQLAPDALDLDRFESLVSAGRTARAEGDLDAAAAELSAALALFHGEPLKGLAGHYLAVQRHRLTERRLKVLSERIDLDLERGRYGDLVPELVALVEEDRLREQFAGQLMLAYWRSGRVSEALDTYGRARAELVEQLGVEPGPGLRAIHQKILRNEGSGVPGPVVRDELPYDGANFVGRDRELTEVVAALTSDAHAERMPVVAIDGMAGVGKTALAIRAARRVAEAYPEGRLFIDLHGYTPDRSPMSSAQVLDRLLRTLAVAADRIPAELEERAALWRSELAGHRVLVVLDNAPDSAVVKPLLVGSPTCAVLVTSRRQLTDLEATTRLALDVLTPDDATALLTEMVGSTRADDEAAAAAVVEYCGYLPLAIRVAGSRLRHRPSWTVEHLGRRLGAQDRRLAELSTDGGGVSPAFALSYGQLPADQQRLFRLLGLMTGHDIDVYAAAAVAGAEPDGTEVLLESLVDANLLLEPSPGRYQFHDLLQYYARSLGETEVDVARRLATYYLYAAADASEAIFSSRLNPLPPPPPIKLPPFDGPADGLAWGDAEGGNVLATLHKTEALGLDELTWRLSLTISPYYYQRSRLDEMDEALELGLVAARRDATDSEAESRILLSIGNLGRYRQGAKQSLQTLQESRRLLPEAADPVLRGRLLASIGYSMVKLDPTDEALAVLAEALEVSRRAGDASLSSRVLAYIGVACGDRLEWEESLQAYEDGLRFARKVNDVAIQIDLLNGIGECLLELGRVDEALEPLETAHALGVERGADYSLIYSLAFLSTAYSRQGDWDEALSVARESVRLAMASGSALSELNARLRLARTLLGVGDAGHARPHFARTLELATEECQEVAISAAAAGLADCDAAEATAREM